MTSGANIVLYRNEAPLDLHLARLTESLGIQCSMIRLGDADGLGQSLYNLESSLCVMVSACSLAAVLQDERMSSEVIAHLFERIPFVLVYGITQDERQAYAVRYLTNGMVASVVNFDLSSYFYQVSATEREITQEFSGLTFGPINHEIDCGLVLPQYSAGFSTLVSINNLPIFGSLKKGNSCLFFLACSQIADVEAYTDGCLSAHKYFSQIVPVVMFL